MPKMNCAITQKINKKNRLDGELDFIEIFKKFENSHKALREFECQRIEILNNLVPTEKESNIIGSTTFYSSYSGFSEADFGGYYCSNFRIDNDYENYSEKDKKKLELIKNFWNGKTSQDKLKKTFNEFEKSLSDMDIGTPALRIGGAVPNYERLLKEGLIGYKKRINIKIKDETDDNKLKFYNALLKTCGLMEQVAEIYKTQIGIFIDNEKNKTEKERLIKISNILNKIPAQPPTTFHEALQMIWFVVITGRIYNLGRFDQYLFNFYENDIKNNILNRNDAFKLLKELWIKLHSLGWGMYEIEKGIMTPKLSQLGKIILAGKKNDGSSAVNDLTYLCLEVTRELKYENPSILVLWHDRVPGDLMDLSIEMIKEGASNPAFFSNELGLNIVNKIGIHEKDTRNFILSDCGEITIEGSSFTSPDASFLGLKYLDLALNNGKMQNNSEQIGPKTGEVSSFKTFKELLDAYFKQVESIFPKAMDMSNKSDKIRNQEASYLFRSLLVDDCISSGKGLFEGGPRYSWLTCELHSMTNLYDSLAVIKKLVFDEKTLTLKELVEMINRNYKNTESTRQILLNKVPKFGNDNPYVDNIAKIIMKHIVDLSKKIKIQYRKNGCVVEMIATNVHVVNALKTNPSADGRKYGMPFSSSIGSTAGMDKEGPTALLKSVSKITKDIINGASVLNISLDYSLLDKKGSKEKIIDLIETYFKIGGEQIQIIVNSKEKLLDAQKHPEKFPNLLVRVGGFSARFVELDKATQDEIIERTFHASA